MSKDVALFPTEQPSRFSSAEAVCVGVLGGPRRALERLTSWLGDGSVFFLHMLTFLQVLACLPMWHPAWCGA